MVNLDKWEEIPYSHIKRNDLIRCITVQGDVISDTRGIVESYDSRGVWNSKGITFLSDPKRFNPAPGGHRTIYRRKAKPFDFPENVGAVIKGTHKETENTYTYVFNGDDWNVVGSALLTSETAFLRAHYKDLVVISEGVKDLP